MPEDRGVIPETERTSLRRAKARGRHQRRVIHDILDEVLICQVGFTDDGTTFVLPSTFVRIDDRLYLHGALGNRMLRVVATGAEVCISATVLDGLVLARSAFHHSMNYRSVMVIGTGRKVEDLNEKRAALVATVEHMAVGRSADARQPTPTELRTTLVVSIPIDEASAKIRVGGPIDEPDDLELPIWAGQIPLTLAAGSPIPEPDLPGGTSTPPYAIRYPDRTRSDQEL
jgi:uncharacterized protein